MIVIEDVQLTPKRVPIGGNYLLRVRARDNADVSYADTTLLETAIDMVAQYNPLITRTSPMSRLLLPRHKRCSMRSPQLTGRRKLTPPQWRSSTRLPHSNGQRGTAITRSHTVT